MTNLEWLLKNDKTNFINAICSTYCWGIKNDGTFCPTYDDITCTECKFDSNHTPCSIKKADWLEAEHEESLLFPIGTPVEVSVNGERDLQYYNGVCNNKHFCTHFYSYIGEAQSNGVPKGLCYNAGAIRKVGDANA